MTESTLSQTDEQLGQLIMSLLDLKSDQTAERVALLLALGQRYIALAQSCEIPSPGGLAAIDCIDERQALYREASNVLTSALAQTREQRLITQITAALVTSIVQCGQSLLALYDAVLATCLEALHLSQPEYQMVRGLGFRALMLLSQGQEEEAVKELQRLSMVIHFSEN